MRAAQEAQGKWVCRQGHEHKRMADKKECNKKHWARLTPKEKKAWRLEVERRERVAQANKEAPEDDYYDKIELKNLREKEIELLGLVDTLKRERDTALGKAYERKKKWKKEKRKRKEGEREVEYWVEMVAQGHTAHVLETLRQLGDSGGTSSNEAWPEEEEEDEIEEGVEDEEQRKRSKIE